MKLSKRRGRCLTRRLLLPLLLCSSLLSSPPYSLELTPAQLDALEQALVDSATALSEAETSLSRQSETIERLQSTLAQVESSASRQAQRLSMLLGEYERQGQELRTLSASFAQYQVVMITATILSFAAGFVIAYFL